MKNLNLEWKQRLQRKAADRARKLYKVRHRQRVRASRRFKPDGSWRRVSDVELVAPHGFSITDVSARPLLIQFITQLRNAVLIERRSVFIDFAQVNRMSACGTLLFVAELDRIMRLTGNRAVIRCNIPRVSKIEQVFDQVGIFRLLGRSPKVNVAEYDDDVRYWEFATGNLAEADNFDSILDEYEGKIAKPLERAIFAGVTEAMTNCVQHAHIAERGDGVPLDQDERRWWMFTQEREGLLSVFLVDLGVGIPRSLPEKNIPGWRDLLKTIVQTLKLDLDDHDCSMIRAAIELGKTRTDLHFRGKGLQDIRNVVENTKSGSLLIHSNYGSYSYSVGREVREMLIPQKVSIMGTLIAWTIPLGELENGA